MDVFEAIRTTRAMRRLDPTRDVSDDDLWTILEAANKGPSGSNRQQLRWVVVRDPERKRRLGELYREVWETYQSAVPGGAYEDPQVTRNMASAEHLAHHLHEAPVILVACARGRRNVEAGVYPGIQNLMLAARALGLGTTLTTMHRGREQEVKALLGIPDDVDTFAMIPVGYPLGRWGEAPRRPVEESVSWEQWGWTRPREATEPGGDT
ncbi:MAG TPA: nitroreductase family protein [Acidimicrobiia bacterium]|nr:nitroreductase family protein [Acidimicrobiia bacterium]